MANGFSLCLRKCSSCEFNCTKILYHESECDCGTDHICSMLCNICSSKARCSLFNGHKYRHVCKLSTHKCQEQCKIMGCDKACTLNPGHEELCKCSSSHPCGCECKMFAECGQLCSVDITVPHEVHDCMRKKCPFVCFFNDGRECCSLNHFHDDELVFDTISDKLVKPHLCGTFHPCPKVCESKGVCSIDLGKIVYKVHKNKYNEFMYPYVDIKPEHKNCVIQIEINLTSHPAPIHICSNLKHTCNQRCPDCNCFCDLQYGHEDSHRSGSHRNKECSEYIALDDHFEDYIIDKDKKTAITIIAGESATPEICDQYCIRKDRGHTHPLPCKGGDLCLEKTDCGFALHSNKLFLSGSEESCFYDFVSCDTY